MEKIPLAKNPGKPLIHLVYKSMYEGKHFVVFPLIIYGERTMAKKKTKLDRLTDTTIKIIDTMKRYELPGFFYINGSNDVNCASEAGVSMTYVSSIEQWSVLMARYILNRSEGFKKEPGELLSMIEYCMNNIELYGKMGPRKEGIIL